MAPLLPLMAGRSTLTIDTSKPTGAVSPLHYGLMTEEINYSYDGGLYGELVRNRAFRDDPKEPAHWSAIDSATLALDPAQSFNKTLTTSLRIQASADGGGVANDGYWGIPVRPSTTYRARFFAKAAPYFTGPVTIAIVSNDGATIYASGKIAAVTGDWKPY
jgi:alpha-L-arabinofuranosidase